MKIFTQVNRSQGMIRTLVGLKSRITSTKPLLTMLALLMVALFGVNESAWGLDPYLTITDFDNSTSYSGTGFNSVTGTTFSVTANHVTFNIEDVSYHNSAGVRRLDYSSQNASSTVNSSFTWSAAKNYNVEVTGVSIGLRGYQAKLWWNLAAANAQFTDGTNSGAKVDCNTNDTGTGGAKTVSISASSVNTPLTLRKITGGNSTTYTITTVTFTYKVTHKKYQYGFDAVLGGVNNNSYGSATATGGGTVYNEFTETTASKQVTFSATPTNTTNYKFVGWYRDAEFTDQESTDNPYTPTLYNSTAGSTNTLTLYAKFDVIGTPVVTCNISDEYEIGHAPIDLQTLWTREGNGAITYSIVPNSFVPSGTNNTGATAPTLSEGRYLSFGQAGTLQLKMVIAADGNDYLARTVTKDITITKKSNSLKCAWDGGSAGNTWTYDVNFDAQKGVLFSSTTANPKPIEVTRTAGEDIVKYNASAHTIKALNKVGYAEWTVSQDENYMYAAASETFRVNVGTTALSSPCYVLAKQTDEQHNSLGGTTHKHTWNDENAAGTVSFEVKHSWGSIDAYVIVQEYVNGTWSNATDGKFDNFGDSYDGVARTLALSQNAKGVQFFCSGSGSGDYIKNVSVTRYGRIDTENENGAAITSITMPENVKGGVTKTKSFYIDYSTCADYIKVVSSNPRVKFTASNDTVYEFLSGHYNAHKEIEVAYISPINEGENLNETITIYTPYEYKSFVITGHTKESLDTHLVYKGAASYTTDATNIAATDLFEVRDENEDVVDGAVITLSSGTASSVTIANDSKSIASLCGNSNDGTMGNIIASYAGDNTHAAATNNGLSQNFTINRLKDEVSFVNGKSVILKDDEYTLSTWASAISGTTITYTSSNESVIKVEGGKLKAVGKGTATLTATSAGNCVYNAGSKALKIKVRISSDPCETLLLDKPDKLSINLYAGTVANYTIADGPQDKLTFKVWKVGGATWNANVYIKNANGTQLKKFQYESGSLSADEPTDPNVEIDLTDAELAGAKTIEIDGSGTLYKYISDLKVSQKSYLIASTSSVTMSTVKACETAQGQFTVSYSDLSRIQLSQTNPNFTYEVWDGETKLDGFNNDCGDYGTYTVKFFYIPQGKGGYSNTVTLTASGKEQVITLSGTANAPEREIVWDIPTGNTISATQSVDLTAYAQTDCESPAGSVYYTYSSAVEGAATIEGSTITFNKAATVTVTAHTVVSDMYEDAETIEKVWTVGKLGTQMRTLPTITSTITYGDNSSVVSWDNKSWAAEDVLNNNEIEGSINYVGPASFTSAGDQNLTFNFSPNDVYAYDVCQFTVPVTVNKASQTITWEPATNISTIDQILLNGTTNGQENDVMNTITYTVTNNNDVISVTNNVVTILKPGTVTITASQNGSANYAAATPVVKNFTISAAPLTLTAPTAQNITYGQALSESELSGGSAKDSKGNDVGGTFAWQSPDAELNAGDNQTPTVVFTPSTNAAWYTNLTTTATIDVAKASQTITWEPATNISTIDQILLNGTTNGQENDVMNTITYTVTNNNDVISVTNNVVTILKPGTVTITASQNGSANYAAATPVVKNFTISAEPLTLTAPTAQNITYGQALSESELTGGSAKDSKNNTVYGTFAWQTGSTQPNASDDAQAFTVVFTPSTNAAWYTDLTTTATVNVNKATSAATPTAAAITYGAKVVTSELSNEGTAGSWAWKEADRNRILSAGDHTLYVNFTPSSTNYSTLEDVAVLLTVNRATATLSWTSAPTELAYNSTATYTATSVSNGAITYSIIAGEEYAHIANGVLTVDQPGHTVTIQASQVDGTNHTTPLAITQVVTIAAAPVNEFTNNNGTGDGDWSNPANWSNGLPTGDADVIISKDVTISSNITVGDLTIEKGATVLIVTGGTLTVTGETEYREAGYGDIHVKDDGNLVFENTADFKVNDFILDAKLGDGTTAREGASGQVENPGKMEIKGDAYFELALDPSGECSQGWYTFTVPFQVNALTGISRYHEGNLISITYNRNYALMVYDEAARATGGKGWNYFKGTLQPGICYTITIDDVDNVYRFKKTNDGAFNTAMTQSLHYTEGEGNGNLRGWNGLGNGTLQHINLGEVTGVDYVQIYDHDQNRYIPSALNEFTYVVGSAFFVQSPEAKPEMTYVAATPAESGILRVAKRHEATKDICLTLTKDGDEYLSDRMYVGASEDAQDSYEIGHDLAKMGTPTEAKVAQIWANEYGLKLCDVEMPLVNNSANCEINLFAPAAGNYELNVEEAPENTMLYLTYNGRAIWNLTYSPYVFDLTKGTTEGYGLKMYVMQVATDLEESGFSDQNSVRKVLIDDVIYIVTPEGKMYDITGKSANY